MPNNNLTLNRIFEKKYFDRGSNNWGWASNWILLAWSTSGETCGRWTGGSQSASGSTSCCRTDSRYGKWQIETILSIRLLLISAGQFWQNVNSVAYFRLAGNAVTGWQTTKKKWYQHSYCNNHKNLDWIIIILSYSWSFNSTTLSSSLISASWL